MIDVALEAGDNRRKMVTKALEALGDDFIEKIKDAKSVFLKVDLAHHDRAHMSSHIDAVRGVIDVLLYNSRTKVYVCDGAYYGTQAAFHQLGYERLLAEYDRVELIDLNDDDFVEGYIFEHDGERRIIKRSKLAESCDVKICLSGIKTDVDFGLLSGVYSWSVGNWIVPSRISAEGRVWARWPWLQEQGAWAQHASIAGLYEQNKFDFVVVDASQIIQIESGIVRSVDMGLVLAGTDGVAVDAVCATLIGLDPADIGYLSMLHDAKVGSINMAQINIPPMQLMQYKKEICLSDELKNHLREWVSSSPNIKIDVD